MVKSSPFSTAYASDDKNAQIESGSFSTTLNHLGLEMIDLFVQTLVVHTLSVEISGTTSQSPELSCEAQRSICVRARIVIRVSVGVL